jgi:hypothetical protein
MNYIGSLNAIAFIGVKGKAIIGLLSVRLCPDNNGYADEKMRHFNKASNRWN